jgi:hypothetical protein
MVIFQFAMLVYQRVYCILYVMNPLHQVVPECESMPRGCNALKWPWAVGSEPVVFPPQVGRGAWEVWDMEYPEDPQILENPQTNFFKDLRDFFIGS